MCCRFAPDLIWRTRRALTPCTGENCGGAGHKNTDWFQIQVWGPLAKFATTLKVGMPVIFEGKIKPETNRLTAWSTRRFRTPHYGSLVSLEGKI